MTALLIYVRKGNPNRIVTEELSRGDLCSVQTMLRWKRDGTLGLIKNMLYNHNRRTKHDRKRRFGF